MESIKAEEADGTAYNPDLSPDQIRAVNHIRARKLMKTEDTIHMNNFGLDSILGLVPNVVTGNLTLKKSGPAAATEGANKSEKVKLESNAPGVVSEVIA